MTATTPQEAVTGWIIIGTIGSFVCALACIASDHMLPWIAAWWRNRRRTFKQLPGFSGGENRCRLSDECLLRDGHENGCYEDSYL